MSTQRQPTTEGVTMPAIELEPLPDGFKAALARCRFVTPSLDHARAWAYPKSEEDAKLLGSYTKYRRCSDPEIHEWEVSITHPDGVALAVELCEAHRA